MNTSSTKHQAQSSPGSIDRITGCPRAAACLLACLFLESSQQPTFPQVRHMRRCTQRSPRARQSSQARALGRRLGLILSR